MLCRLASQKAPDRMRDIDASNPVLQAALKPFQVLESLGIAAQYERSFKIEPRRLLTQRYMLGVSAQSAPHERFVEAARRLGMPASALPQFEKALPEASVVLFGFEGTAETDQTAGASVLKVYTEHRSRLSNRARGDAPVEVFRGFKWRPDQPGDGIQTLYWCRPGLAADEIRTQVAEHLAAPALEPVREMVAATLERAIHARPGFTPQWLELGESGQPIRAFDLNLYEAGLRVAAIGPLLARLAHAYAIEPGLMDRLLDVAGSGLLGHLSAGVSRAGTGFLTIYFEPHESAGSPSAG